MWQIKIGTIAAHLIKQKASKNDLEWFRFKQVIDGMASGGLCVPLSLQSGTINFEKYSVSKTIKLRAIIDKEECSVSESRLLYRKEIPEVILANHYQAVADQKLFVGNIISFDPLKNIKILDIERSETWLKQTVIYRFEETPHIEWRKLCNEIENTPPEADFLSQISD